MRLHHHPLSTCSARVRLAALHLGLKLDLVPVDLLKGEQMSPAFLALNPNHRVPVLEHDGLVLWESYAIMQYLADLTPDQSVYPTDPRARADVNRWLFWCAQTLMPAVTALNWENHIKPMAGLGAPDAARVAQGEAQFKEAAELLDRHLEGARWLCPSGLSLADLAIAAPLVDREAAGMPMGGRRHLLQWFDRVQALPAWQAEAAAR